jgi:hypothetical protein
VPIEKFGYFIEMKWLIFVPTLTDSGKSVILPMTPADIASAPDNPADYGCRN